MAGDEVIIDVEDETIATVQEKGVSGGERKHGSLSAWERTVQMRKLVIKGVAGGSTLLTGKLPDGRHWVKPVNIRVVDNAEYRQCAGPAEITAELRQELQQIGLRAAVLRVAEDQLNSSLGRTVHGGSGRYGLSQGVDWCDGFAHWCYKSAATAKRETNPFGDDVNTLASPQKAISWALQTGSATILRYQGGDPYGRDFQKGAPLGPKNPAKVEKYIEIDAANPVLAGDICLVRDSANWRHVALVYEPPSGETFVTIDGNQGYPSIKKVERNLNEELPGSKSYKYVFLHLNLPSS